MCYSSGMYKSMFFRSPVLQSCQQQTPPSHQAWVATNARMPNLLSQQFGPCIPDERKEKQAKQSGA